MYQELYSVGSISIRIYLKSMKGHHFSLRGDKFIRLLILVGMHETSLIHIAVAIKEYSRALQFEKKKKKERIKKLQEKINKMRYSKTTKQISNQ